MKRSYLDYATERDRVARAARCATASSRAGVFLFDARAGPHARQEIRQIRPRGRRRDGKASARRPEVPTMRSSAWRRFLHAPRLIDAG